MPSVRIERVPVRTLGLGVLGFDHLQLVYVRDWSGSSSEDGWFVIEGLRQASVSGLKLSVEGLYGATTLSEANGGATGAALAAKIGTAAMRGSREIASGPEAPALWATFVAHASDIEAQSFPYIAYALPASPLPTINSSSLVGTLLHRAGLDIAQSKPDKMRLSPGTETLLGTAGDDVLSPVKGFTTIVAGDGSDWLTGSFDERGIDKLYGGKGDDHFQWSKSTNIIHGGQPELAYADDGRDTVHYTGVGQVTITANPAPIPHQSPDFIATFDGGGDQLFSIEEIVWDGESDRVELGRGAGLIEMPITLTPGSETSGSRGDLLDLSRTRHGLLIDGGPDGETCVMPAASAPGTCAYRIAGAEWIIGTPGADRIHAGPATRGVESGGGDDVIDASDGNVAGAIGIGPRGFDMEIAGGAGRDVIVSGPGRTAAAGGRGADLFVLGPRTDELVIEDAEPQDRVLAPGLAEARHETDGRAPNDLLIRIERAGGSDALIRVLGFREGDLGLALNSTDRPLLYPDTGAAFGDAWGEEADAPSMGLAWWWDDVLPIDATRAMGPALSGVAAHATELVYDGGHVYPDGCNTDDPDPCSW